MSKSASRISWPLPVRRSWVSVATAGEQPAPQTPPGSPPVVGAAAPVGPQVDAATFAAAQKLVQVELTNAERERRLRRTGAAAWRRSVSDAAGPTQGGTRCRRSLRTRPGTPFSPDTPSLPRATGSCAASGRSARFPQPKPKLPWHPCGSCRAGSRPASSLPSSSRASICNASTPSTRNFAAS